MKKLRGILVLLCFFVLLTGCKKEEKKQSDSIKEENTKVEEHVEPETVEKEEVQVKENHEGKVVSKLTGEWVDEEIGKKRPYAIMFNNIKLASPQAGTSQAAILYEAIVEGGITRMMGIFEQFDAERIGSVRSARHYFVSFADEYDAIYVHFGETKYATAKIKELNIDNLSGLTGIGSTVYFRDHSIKAPHNAFASTEGILKGTKKLGYRTERKEDMDNHFSFYDVDTDVNSDQIANKVVLHFSNYTSPYFIYNKEDKQYKRFQFGDKHVDKNTNEQLSFKNIIVQFVKEWDIDKNGYQTMDIENSSGEGYYITNGKLVPISWKKNESTKKMHYYDQDKNVLRINPGKRYIAIFPTNHQKEVEISE